MLSIEEVKEILTSNKVVAVVGFSDNRERPSNRVARYLHGNDFTVYGVNPRFDGKEIDEIVCHTALKNLPEHADIINIFRRSEFVFDLVNEILELDYKPNVIWTQIGVISSEAKELAESRGIVYVENKCIMVEHNKI